MLEQLLEEMLGQGGRPASPVGDMVAALFQGVPSTTGGGRNGLNALVQQFETSGLGPIMASWVGAGPNQPITAEQLARVLGTERVQAIGVESGMPPQEILEKLAMMLPGMVDRMTPNGHLPNEADRST